MILLTLIDLFVPDALHRSSLEGKGSAVSGDSPDCELSDPANTQRTRVINPSALGADAGCAGWTQEAFVPMIGLEEDLRAVRLWARILEAMERHTSGGGKRYRAECLWKTYVWSSVQLFLTSLGDRRFGKNESTSVVVRSRWFPSRRRVLGETHPKSHPLVAQDQSRELVRKFGPSRSAAILSDRWGSKGQLCLCFDPRAPGRTRLTSGQYIGNTFCPATPLPSSSFFMRKSLKHPKQKECPRSQGRSTPGSRPPSERAEDPSVMATSSKQARHRREGRLSEVMVIARRLEERCVGEAPGTSGREREWWFEVTRETR